MYFGGKRPDINKFTAKTSFETAFLVTADKYESIF